MPRRYAAETTVSVSRSKMEIEAILTRYGADQFMTGWDGESAQIAFRADGRYIRFRLPLPDKDDEEFTLTPTGKSRAADAALAAWEKAQRQSWRALGLVIKAKLEAIDAGISDFDAEFLAHIVMPDNKTVAEHIMPRIEEAYDSGQMPLTMLPAPAEGVRHAD